ncbi:site-specific recombinase, partial [human gut metagenome]
MLENPVYTGTMVYNRIAYDETYRKIGQNPREDWRMVPDSHPAIISWELFDEVSALREAEQAVRDERKKWCRQRRENNPNIFKGRIFCKECGEKLVCHWQSDGLLYFYCKFCHVSVSEKDLWNGIHKELRQRMEEHKNLKKLIQKNSGKSSLEA